MNIAQYSKHFVYVNSLNRLSGTVSDFTYNINLPVNRNFTKVVVLDALIPKSYYLIDSTDNTFTLVEGLDTATVTIPIGNYTFFSFQEVVSTQLTSASPHGWTYTVSYPNTNDSADTGKWIITVTGNTSQPIIEFREHSSLNEQFGFDVGSTNTFVSNTLTSANVIKLQIEDSIFINSNLISGSPNQLSVLQHINVVGSPTFSTVTYQCTAPDHFAKEIRGQVSSTASFSLTDQHNKPIDLNGLPFSCTLVFYEENKYMDVLNLAKDYIRYLINKESEQRQKE